MKFYEKRWNKVLPNGTSKTYGIQTLKIFEVIF